MRLVFLFLIFCAAVIARADSEPRLINGIAAIVFNEVITEEEVERQVEQLLPTLQAKYAAHPEQLDQKFKQLRQERLEELIERQMILYEFSKAGYSFPESIIDDRIKSLIRERFGDRLTLTKTLQSQGTTYEAFRKQFRDQWIVEQMRMKNISSEILISPYKIEKYYQSHAEDFKVGDQVKLRMIYLDKSKHGGSTRKLADEILSKLKEGAAFADMASVYSDSAQRKEGGDYGWRERTFLRDDLAKAAFSLKPGQVSEVLETKDDCHLLLVEETKPAHARALSEVRPDIEKILKQEEQDRLHRNWIEKLRKKSFVRYF
ncbi:MAG TPA: peptidylprolyl isomerase [Verrucomicrobiae bacterium]|nr:peptidylprolyl isomerase [Verrucomicrobiae bacterium]